MRIAHGIFISSVLLEVIRIHKVPELTVAVEELQGQVGHIGTFQALTTSEGALPNAAGFQVAQLDPVKGLPLTRLDQFVLQDAARVAIQHDFQPNPEIIDRISGHRSSHPREKSMLETGAHETSNC